MPRPLALLVAVCATIVVFSASAKAQYTTGSTSFGYNQATSQLISTGQTVMDSTTYAWYQGHVRTNIIRQGTNTVVATGEDYSSPGSDDRASIQVTAGVTPGADYLIESFHQVLPLSNYWCTLSRIDFYFYSSIVPTTYYGQQTWYGQNHGTNTGTCVGGWIYLGRTIQTYRVPPPAINITSPRVAGNLQSTFQQALLGGDVTLNTHMTPSDSGGTYSWQIAGPHTVVSGGGNSPSISLRWMETGTYSVQVTYVKNGASSTSVLTVNVLMPTMSALYADMLVTDQVTRGMGCSITGGGAVYSLGCGTASNPNTGIVFNTVVNLPAGALLSDPAQGGFVFKQLGSEYTKRKLDLLGSFFGQISYKDGRDECLTGRASAAEIDTGWQLDGQEAYGGRVFQFTSTGVSYGASTQDWPGQALDGSLYMSDAMNLDVAFEMYVYYFSGAPNSPIVTRPMGLSSAPNFRLHKIPWRWGGQAYFDTKVAPAVKYVLDYSITTPPGRINAVGANAPRAYNSVLSFAWRQCPGDPPPTGRRIDSTRYFVRQQYLDALGRDPDDYGWDDWTTVITRCIFDGTCIRDRRVMTAKGFLESPEIRDINPILLHPSSTHEYNREYVRLCYDVFLNREPEEAGWNQWTDYIDQTGDYWSIVHGFIYSDEYRNIRFPGV